MVDVQLLAAVVENLPFLLALRLPLGASFVWSLRVDQNTHILHQGLWLSSQSSCFCQVPTWSVFLWYTTACMLKVLNLVGVIPK